MYIGIGTRLQSQVKLWHNAGEGRRCAAASRPRGGTCCRWQNTKRRLTRSYGVVVARLSIGRGIGMRAHLTERLRVEVDDVAIDETSLPGHQGRLALAYLLVEHRRPVPRDELADLLWRGEPPGSWEKGLAVVVSKLRA